VFVVSIAKITSFRNTSSNQNTVLTAKWKTKTYQEIANKQDGFKLLWLTISSHCNHNSYNTMRELWLCMVFLFWMSKRCCKWKKSTSYGGKFCSKTIRGKWGQDGPKAVQSNRELKACHCEVFAYMTPQAAAMVDIPFARTDTPSTNGMFFSFKTFPMCLQNSEIQ
jgi:hypothetical protein